MDINGGWKWLVGLIEYSAAILDAGLKFYLGIVPIKHRSRLFLFPKRIISRASLRRRPLALL